MPRAAHCGIAAQNFAIAMSERARVCAPLLVARPNGNLRRALPSLLSRLATILELIKVDKVMINIY